MLTWLACDIADDASAFVERCVSLVMDDARNRYRLACHNTSQPKIVPILSSLRCYVFAFACMDIISVQLPD